MKTKNFVSALIFIASLSQFTSCSKTLGEQTIKYRFSSEKFEKQHKQATADLESLLSEDSQDDLFVKITEEIRHNMEEANSNGALNDKKDELEKELEVYKDQLEDESADLTEILDDNENTTEVPQLEQSIKELKAKIKETETLLAETEKKLSESTKVITAEIVDESTLSEFEKRECESIKRILGINEAHNLDVEISLDRDDHITEVKIYELPRKDKDEAKAILLPEDLLDTLERAKTVEKLKSDFKKKD